MKGEPLPCPDQLDRPPAQILLQARKPTHEPDFDREPFEEKVEGAVSADQRLR
jgi:hypothetical protein